MEVITSIHSCTDNNINDESLEGKKGSLGKKRKKLNYGVRQRGMNITHKQSGM